MAKKYDGLKAERIFFGDSEIGTVTIPTGYSGCEVGSISLYVTPLEGMTASYGSCYYWDEDDIIFNWASYSKRQG